MSETYVETGTINFEQTVRHKHETLKSGNMDLRYEYRGDGIIYKEVGNRIISLIQVKRLEKKLKHYTVIAVRVRVSV